MACILKYCCNIIEKCSTGTADQNNSSTSNNAVRYNKRRGNSFSNPFYETLPLPRFLSRRERKEKAETGTGTAERNLENPIYSTPTESESTLSDIRSAPSLPAHSEAPQSQKHQVNSPTSNSSAADLENRVYDIPDRNLSRRAKRKTSRFHASTSQQPARMQSGVVSQTHQKNKIKLMHGYENPSVLSLV